MVSPLSLTQEFPAPPADVHALLTSREFLEGRLKATGGLDPEVVSIDTDDGGSTTTVTTRQGIPADVLPPMVATMMAGNPVTERVETWRPEADGFAAAFELTVKGAPASLKGTMALRSSANGCTLTIDGAANVPIPMFGPKIESIIVEQIGTILDSEAEYTRSRLT